MYILTSMQRAASQLLGFSFGKSSRFTIHQRLLHVKNLN